MTLSNLQFQIQLHNFPCNGIFPIFYHWFIVDRFGRPRHPPNPTHPTPPTTPHSPHPIFLHPHAVSVLGFGNPWACFGLNLLRELTRDQVKLTKIYQNLQGVASMIPPTVRIFKLMCDSENFCTASSARALIEGSPPKRKAPDGAEPHQMYAVALDLCVRGGFGLVCMR